MHLQRIELSKDGHYEYLGCTDEEFSYLDLGLMQQVQEAEGGSIYTVQCFSDLCSANQFNKFDGIGYYHNGFGLTNVSVWDNTSNPKDYLYVCWFDRKG